MTDHRVFPSPKSPASSGSASPTFPATKGQLYGAAARSIYRPGRRHHRGCCCRLCLWTTIAIFILLLLVAAVAAVFYAIYRPHRPSFSVTSFRLGYLSTTTSGVKSKFSLAVTARNPNKKLVYLYSPIDVTVLASDITVGKGNIPAFVHGKRNSTVLKSSATSSSQPLDSETLSKMKAEIKAKAGVPLKLRLDTKVRVKAGSLKTPRIGIRVICDGIRAVIPASSNAPAIVSMSDDSCEVKTKIKIWKWTFLF
ncbi:hypothetical protein SAY86_017539 [Trapa natans]|uniref:Late embryogenesis abundant protein LEA-2 subgroup domain-containing protein n=1 Tax=Trapa natans TaxID=22666 RepID=A0AAN7R6L4_TRANT|nr:hypothetical protein SAY86_017539 [Trapa natans]